MKSVHEIRINPDTYRVDHYPWKLLRETGDEVLLFGKMLNMTSAIQNAYNYAKRHNFKVSALPNREASELRVIRRAASDGEINAENL